MENGTEDGLTATTELESPSRLRCLPLAELIAGVQAERRNFMREEPRDDSFALELLARAIRFNDHFAWDAFITEYGDAVTAHINRHPLRRVLAEDDDFLLNRTFQRFIGAIRPERLDQFSSLAAVLGYLNMCGISVLLDELRRQKRRQHVSLDDLPDSIGSSFDVEGSIIERVAAQDLWQLILGELTDESERLIARLSFKYGYKPHDIYRGHSNRFPSIRDVYRTKRNMIERLRRNPKILQIVEELRTNNH